MEDLGAGLSPPVAQRSQRGGQEGVAEEMGLCVWSLAHGRRKALVVSEAGQAVPTVVKVRRQNASEHVPLPVGWLCHSRFSLSRHEMDASSYYIALSSLFLIIIFKNT